MKAKGFTLLLLIAYGCVPPVWHKPGATEQEFYQARLRCDEYQGQVRLREDVREAISPSYYPDDTWGRIGAFGEGLARGERIGDAFNVCMKAHGWSLVPNKQ